MKYKQKLNALNTLEPGYYLVKGELEGKTDYFPIEIIEDSKGGVVRFARCGVGYYKTVENLLKFFDNVNLKKIEIPSDF